VGGETATAAQVVLAAPPADDTGASTADRYDWQASMAAADGLALYLDALGDGELRADYDGRARFALARATDDRARAVELARAARERLQGAAAAEDAADVERWLAAR